MNYVGKKINHKVFGLGIVVEQYDRYIVVEFLKQVERKKFIVPDAFEKFLQLMDENDDKKIKEIIREKKHDKQIKNAQIAAESRQNSSYAGGKTSIPRYESVEAFCEAFKGTIGNEVSYLRKNGGKKQIIFDGKYVKTEDGFYIYTFEADSELSYPEGTPINIWKNEITIPASIIECEDFNVIIRTKDNLGIEVSEIEISAEPWMLLDKLKDRLDGIRKTKIVKALVCDGRKEITYGKDIITTQMKAIEMSQSQPITFVWGPPGTGKTETLSEIVWKHIKRGNRVLMLSYSNVSVDGAILRVDSKNENYKPGTIARYGYPKLKEIIESKCLTSYSIAINRHPQLSHERANLISERKKLSRSSKRYVDIGKRLIEIKDIISSEEIEVVNSAKFIATTVSKAVVDSHIYNSKFDVVIFDEASMAYIPHVIYSASLAEKHFICMGDFKQLPPIVQDKNSKQLNVDIFQYCGIKAAVDRGIRHNWMCMLNEQHRMHPQISDFVSEAMYNGLLNSGKEMYKKTEDIVKISPFSGYPIAFADLSGMMNVCTKTGDNSRVNVLSAFISYALALEAAQKADVGIITPYHTQSRLFHAMARDTAEFDNRIKSISCATVHQFQGSEKDIIIYDAVDCYRMTHPGHLILSAENDYANRLFNVALTRAKGKFIGVANISYMEKKSLKKDLIFRKIIDNQKFKPSCLNGNKILMNKTVLKNMNIYGNCKDGYEKFISDIRDAKKEIRIDIPDKPKNEKYVIDLCREIKSAKVRGVKILIRAENKENLPNVLKSLTIENFNAVNPVSIIDKEYVWFGMPTSDANFKSEGKIIQTKYHPIIRI